MSPLFAPLVLAIFLGLLIFLTGLLFRKKKLLLIGCPAVLLTAAWLVTASIPPDPRAEFGRLFGDHNSSAVTEVHTLKPTFMGGYFMDFRISVVEFQKRIVSECKETEFTNFHLLRDQKLPKGWPQSAADTESALGKVVDHDKVLIFYDPALGRAFVSVLYDHW